MDWPRRRNALRHSSHCPHSGVMPYPISYSVSPSSPVTVRPELTDPELARLEEVEVVLPEGVELMSLAQQDTPLPDKGRLTDGKILNPDRIAFTVVATTEAGVKMIHGLRHGTVNIIPQIITLGDGKLSVRMHFDDVPEVP